MRTEVVIVGGGPVGCWTALQIKRNNPDAQIIVYEKNIKYQRDHMMSINRDTFLSGFSKEQTDQEKKFFEKIINADQNHTENLKSNKNRRVMNIRTLDLENILREECGAMGIDVKFGNIESPEVVMNMHPECSLFVAADGAHSKMRNCLLGQDSKEEADVLYSVDVKYRAINASYTSEPTYDKIDMIVVENVGKLSKDGEEGSSRYSHPVALRFLVDEFTFNSIPDATFKKPLLMSGVFADPENPGKLLKRPNKIGEFEDAIRKFQNIRAKYGNETLIEGSERVTKVKLSQYASKKFSVMSANENGQRAGWFFVGDAAMGVPFYRSINAGLLLGSKLGQVLGDKSTTADIKSQIFEAQREPTIKREFGIVSRKLRGIRIYNNYLRPVLKASKTTGRAASKVAIVPLAIVAIPLVPLALAGVYIANKCGYEVRLM